MLYKCDNCNYTTKRLSDLRRHQNKKRPCINKIKVNVDNLEVTSNIHSFSEILHSFPEILHSSPEILHSSPEIIHETNNNKLFICSKCQKQFTRKDNLKVHEKKCDGLDSKQCKICLKLFATSQSRWNHNKNVKCSPPPNPII